jgi:hypothetical protein
LLPVASLLTGCLLYAVPSFFSAGSLVNVNFSYFDAVVHTLLIVGYRARSAVA